MPLLIDGYNLLHVTGVTGRRGDLHGSREALLRVLASALEPAERAATTIVFDAAEAPPGLPRTVVHEAMTVRYASDYEDADALIEELIAAHHVPRSLTVVSSDHRIQRAARRRRAPFIDSDAWFAQTVRRRGAGRRPPPPAGKPHDALSDAELKYWLAAFAEGPEQDASAISRRSDPAASDAPHDDDAPQADELANPFPPGYADDLADEN